jgi:hypothetical protein
MTTSLSNRSVDYARELTLSATHSFQNVAIDAAYLRCFENRQYIRAVVYLAVLTPADVLVEASTVRGPEVAPVADRLWSVQSYGNGRFVFERVITPGERGARQWHVRVALSCTSDCPAKEVSYAVDGRSETTPVVALTPLGHSA